MRSSQSHAARPATRAQPPPSRTSRKVTVEARRHLTPAGSLTRAASRLVQKSQKGLALRSSKACGSHFLHWNTVSVSVCSFFSWLCFLIRLLTLFACSWIVLLLVLVCLVELVSLFWFSLWVALVLEFWVFLINPFEGFWCFMRFNECWYFWVLIVKFRATFIFSLILKSWFSLLVNPLWVKSELSSPCGTFVV